MELTRRVPCGCTITGRDPTATSRGSSLPRGTSPSSSSDFSSWVWAPMDPSRTSSTRTTHRVDRPRGAAQTTPTRCPRARDRTLGDQVGEEGAARCGSVRVVAQCALCSRTSNQKKMHLLFRSFANPQTCLSITRLPRPRSSTAVQSTILESHTCRMSSEPLPADFLDAVSRAVSHFSTVSSTREPVSARRGDL